MGNTDTAHWASSFISKWYFSQTFGNILSSPIIYIYFWSPEKTKDSTCLPEVCCFSDEIQVTVVLVQRTSLSCHPILFLPWYSWKIADLAYEHIILWFCFPVKSIKLLSFLIQSDRKLLYSQRHSMINHCDRRITHLGDMNISFVLCNISSNFLLWVTCNHPKCINRLNRTKNISELPRWVIHLSQWFIIPCIWMYYTI